jgi:hypothetical protein
MVDEAVVVATAVIVASDKNSSGRSKMLNLLNLLTGRARVRGDPEGVGDASRVSGRCISISP